MEKIYESFVSIISGVYILAGRFYDFLVGDLLTAEIISNDRIAEFTDRLYIIFGVFILFRILFTLLNSLINPDKINDKQEGLGNIAVRVAVAFIMIVAAPMVFKFLFRLQDSLIKDETFSNLFLTNSSTKLASSSNFDKYLGNDTPNISQQALIPLANGQTTTCNYYMILDGVAYDSGMPSGSFSGYGTFSITLIENDNGQYKLGSKKYDIEDYSSDFLTSSAIGYTIVNKPNFKASGNINFDNGCPATVDFDTDWFGLGTKVQNIVFKNYSTKNVRGICGNVSEEYTVKCAGAEAAMAEASGGIVYGPEDFIQSKDEFFDSFTIPPSPGIMISQNIAASFMTCSTKYEAECQAIKNDTNFLLSNTSQKAIAKAKADDKMDLGFIISVLFGIILLFFYTVLTVDIAVRYFKLLVLQLIAPIPIAAYVDPKSKQTFDNYIKALLATYLELFFKIAAVSLITWFVKESRLGESGAGLQGFTLIIYFIGLLLFAKMAPEFLGKALGIKDMAKGFTLNPFQRLRETPIIGAGIAGISGAAGGYIVSGGSLHAALIGGRSAANEVGFMGADPGKRVFQGGLLRYGASSVMSYTKDWNLDSEDFKPVNRFSFTDEQIVANPDLANLEGKRKWNIDETGNRRVRMPLPYNDVNPKSANTGNNNKLVEPSNRNLHDDQISGLAPETTDESTDQSVERDE